MLFALLRSPLAIPIVLILHLSLTADIKKTSFSSESVCAGHPDKICDQISDAILDAILSQDAQSKAGIETVVGGNYIALYGEVNTKAVVNYEEIARKTIREIGYTNPAWGFSDQSIFENRIHQQSPDIAVGVEDDRGAGDQGMMFGYACIETPQLMPMSIILAHALVEKLDQQRKLEEGIGLLIRPDGKSQVTVAYQDGRPSHVEKVVIAISHSEEIENSALKQAIIKEVISPVLKDHGMDIPSAKHIIVNGAGLWHIPGPQSDAGLTGRKIVVDTYGGYARVGGGAFSGKDPSKVDRSGAYAARYIAKNIVAAGFAEKCEIALAYVIGYSKPLMAEIETFGTSKDLDVIRHFAEALLNTSVKEIISQLELRRPIYQATATYGHFGRDRDFPWEKIQFEMIADWRESYPEALVWKGV
jgi:S-adenosylmethionine synthetase